MAKKKIGEIYNKPVKESDLIIEIQYTITRITN